MSQQPPPYGGPPYGGPPYGGPPYGGPPYGGPPYGGPPYGGPPYGGPPYSGPPGPYPPNSHGGQPGGRSNTWKFWMGVLLTLPVFLVASLLTGAVSSIVDALGVVPEIGSAFSGLIALGLLAGFIAMLVLERTRWIALGILAGTAVLLILAAGACVALLIALTNSYN